jgi:hypothetical protein
MDSVTSTAMKMRGKVSPAVFRAVIYIVAFVTGAIVMSFEMLGSRYLNPYFRQRHLHLGGADLDGAGGVRARDVLTDDFAPADLYRMTPIGVPKRQ